MSLSFKQYLTEMEYNWAINPRDWSDIGPSNAVTRDTLGNIPPAAVSKLWGKRDPKPSDKFVEEPTVRKFIVRYKGESYLVDLGKPGSNHRNFKRVAAGSRMGGEKRTSSVNNPKTWRDVHGSVPSTDLQNVPVYSATKLWAEGGRAMPDSPFQRVPQEKQFIAKIANARYLIKLGKTPNDRTISRVNPGSASVLNKGSRS